MHLASCSNYHITILQITKSVRSIMLQNLNNIDFFWAAVPMAFRKLPYYQITKSSVRSLMLQILNNADFFSWRFCQSVLAKQRGNRQITQITKLPRCLRPENEKQSGLKVSLKGTILLRNTRATRPTPRSGSLFGRPHPPLVRGKAPRSLAVAVPIWVGMAHPTTCQRPAFAARRRLRPGSGRSPAHR